MDNHCNLKTINLKTINLKTINLKTINLKTLFSHVNVINANWFQKAVLKLGCAGHEKGGYVGSMMTIILKPTKSTPHFLLQQSQKA